MTRKVRLHCTVPVTVKELMVQDAKRRGISLAMWIEEVALKELKTVAAQQAAVQQPTPVPEPKKLTKEMIAESIEFLKLTPDDLVDGRFSAENEYHIYWNMRNWHGLDIKTEEIYPLLPWGSQQ